MSGWNGRPVSVRDVRRVMFVCLGNICRSPLAQGVFAHLAAQRGVAEDLTIESAGTGHWHIGDPPDKRSSAVAKKHGVELRSRGQQIDESYFGRFDLFVAMDRSNVGNLRRMGCPEERLALMLAFAPESLKARHPGALSTLEVPDPYHDGPEGFDVVYELVHESCVGLLDEILRVRA